MRKTVLLMVACMSFASVKAQFVVEENGSTAIRYNGTLPVISNLAINSQSNTVVYNSENDVYIGNHVDSSSDYGDVTIESGATLNIDFENRVVIQSGIKCKAGGRFRLNYQYL